MAYALLVAYSPLPPVFAKGLFFVSQYLGSAKFSFSQEGE
jgi:hypothetical protein